MRRVHQESVDKSCTVRVGEGSGDSGDRDLMCADLQWRWWSAPRDHAKIGTPALTLSRVEFQPQWLRKPPVAGWFRIFVGGAHPEEHILVPLLCPQNLLHVTRVLRLGLGF
jgi:hypothetical protein